MHVFLQDAPLPISRDAWKQAFLLSTRYSRFNETERTRVPIPSRTFFSPYFLFNSIYIIILCWARSHKSWKSEKFPSSSSLKQRRMKKGEGKNWKENDTCGILGSLFARPTKRSSNLELSFEESRWTASGC